MKKKKALQYVAKKSSPKKKSAKVDKKEKEDYLPKAVEEHVTEFNSSMEKRKLPYRAEWDKDRTINIKNNQYGNILKVYQVFRNRKELEENPSAQVIFFRKLKEKNEHNI